MNEAREMTIREQIADIQADIEKANALCLEMVGPPGAKVPGPADIAPRPEPELAFEVLDGRIDCLRSSLLSLKRDAGQLLELLSRVRGSLTTASEKLWG